MVTIETYMSIGDYIEYTKALETLEACKVVARRHPVQAAAMRHKAREAVATLEARYA